MTDQTVPPGAPGITPRWTSSAKSAVGTAAGRRAGSGLRSATVSSTKSITRLDTASIRDFGFIVTAKDYFSEEKRDTDHTVVLIEDGVPAFRLVNTSRDGRYRITKSVLSDPNREVVLQEFILKRWLGKPSDYQVYALISPHLVNAGTGEYGLGMATSREVPMLFAEAQGQSLAVVSSVPWTCAVGRLCRDL